MKRESIVSCARELFKQYGYKKVSMDEIALKSGVTKKTIYRYFHDKEELFQYFITEELSQMKEIFDEVENLESAFLEKLTKGLKEILLFRKNSEFIRCIMIDINKGGCMLPNILKKYDDEVIDYLEEKIQKAIYSKEIKKCNAHLMAFVIYKMFFSIFFEYDQNIDIDEVILEVTSILRDGIFIEGEFNNEK